MNQSIAAVISVIVLSIATGVKMMLDNKKSEHDPVTGDLKRGRPLAN